MFSGGFPFQPRAHAVQVDPSLVHTLSECVSTRRDDSARMSTSSIQTYNNNENISKVGDTKTPVNSKSESDGCPRCAREEADDDVNAFDTDDEFGGDTRSCRLEG